MTGRQPRHVLHVRDVLALMPATRREILAGIGWSSMAQDRALGDVLQRLRESGRIRFAQVPNKDGGRVVWSRVECAAFIPQKKRLLSDVCRCFDRDCPDRIACERWLQRDVGRVAQVTFRGCA